MFHLPSLDEPESNRYAPLSMRSIRKRLSPANSRILGLMAAMECCVIEMEGSRGKPLRVIYAPGCPKLRPGVAPAAGLMADWSQLFKRSRTIFTQIKGHDASLKRVPAITTKGRHAIRLHLSVDYESPYLY